jgi:nonribosomal peptide synthetase protein BlmVI
MSRASPEDLLDRLAARASEEPDRILFGTIGADGGVGDLVGTAAFWRSANAFAAALRQRVPQGGRVLLCLPAGTDFAACLIGCFIAGLVAVPAPPLGGRRTLSRIAAIVADCDARQALVPDIHRPGLAATVEEVAPGLALLPVSELDAKPHSLTVMEPPPPDALAMLQYTSGSTSNPRGVRLSRRNISENEAVIEAHYGIGADDLFVNWLPMHHDLGLIGTLLQPVYTGAKSYLLPPQRFLRRPLSWIEAISAFEATVAGGPNFAFEHVLRVAPTGPPTRLDLGRWRVAFCGGEPVRSETLSRFAERFAADGFDAKAFCPTYGLAEATVFVCGGAPGEGVRHLTVDPKALRGGRIVVAPRGRVLVSNGRPPPGHVIAIAEPGESTLAANGLVGEICVAGPAVSEGYWTAPPDANHKFEAVIDGLFGHGFLRTGDLGFIHYGELFICGRRSDLIILRGQNHHPEDLERRAEACSADIIPGGTAAIPVERDGEEKVAILVELSSGTDDLAIGQLARKLRSTLIEWHEVDPAEIVFLAPGTLPRTSSGKIQRKAVAIAWSEGILTPRFFSSSETSPAIGELGHTVEAILADVLGVPAGELELGGLLSGYGLDSLRAAQLSQALKIRAGVKVSTGWLLRGRRVADLLGLHSGGGASQAPPAEPASVAIGDAIPLNPAQAAFWYLDRLGRRADADVIAGGIELAERPDPARLEAAFRQLLMRHPPLRSRIAECDGRPVAILEPAPADAFRHHRVGSEARAMIERIVRSTMNLTAGPVARLDLVEADGTAPVLIFRLHHVAGDFESVRILLSELRSLYAGRDLPPAIPAPSSTFDFDDTALEAWRARIGHCGSGPDLPRDSSNTASTESSERHAVLSAAASRRLAALAARRGSTLNAALLAALQVLCAYLGNAQTCVVGMPVLNRDYPGAEGAVGCLANILPMSTAQTEGMSFVTLLDRVTADLAAALDGQSVPFATMIEGLAEPRDDGTHSLLNVVFSWYGRPDHDGDQALAALAINWPGVLSPDPALDGRTIRLPGKTAQYPLSILGAEVDGRIVLTMRARTAHFDHDGLRRLSLRLRYLLAAIARNPAAPLSALELVLPEERRRIGDLNATDRDATRGGTLSEMILAQAERHPNAVAVSFGDARQTYAELSAAARAVRTALHHWGIAPGSAVAVSMPRQLDLPAVLVGILAAGCALLPLDPDEPSARRDKKLEMAGAVLLVTDQGTDCASVLWAAPTDLLVRSPMAEPGTDPEDDPLCYVLFTSGSTGTPKGVMVPHSAIRNRLAWMQRYCPIGPGDIVLHKTPASFDVSIWELFWPLVQGAEIVLAEPGGHRDPLYLVQLIRERGVNVVHFVPSMLEAFLEGWASVGASRHRLRHVFCSGEALPADVARRARRALGCSLSNLFGPTEAAIDVTAWPVGPDDAQDVPIGHPIDNTVIEILDSRMRRMPPGCAGELAIGGVGLAWGYAGQPGLTAERFVPDPYRHGRRLYLTGDLAWRRRDGAIMFAGRRDNQIKRRGRRIEPGEIEAVLRTHPDIAATGVVAVADKSGALWLVAHVVTRSQEMARDLADFLGSRLPAELLPDHLLLCDTLPTTASGKLDRRALVARGLPTPRSAGGSAVTQTEARLAEIWAATLSIDAEIGPNTDFFALGGHSLLLARLQVRVFETFRVRLPLQRLIGLSSLSAMARAIDTSAREHRRPPRSRPDAGPAALPLSSYQMPIFLKEHFSRVRGLFDMPIELVFEIPPPPQILREALDLMSARHPALRSDFRIRDGIPEQVLHPVTTIALDISDGDDPDSEQAAQTGNDRPNGRSGAVGRRSADAAVPGNPPLRTHLVRWPDGTALLRLHLHHLVADGQAAARLIGELCTACTALASAQRPDLPPVRASLADLLSTEADAMWSEDGARARRYWRDMLADAPPPGVLPHDGTASGAARTLIRALGRADFAALARRAADARATLYALLMTGYAILHHRLTGDAEILSGMPVSARPGSDFDNTLACFVSVLPLRIPLQRTDAVEPLLQTVQTRIVEALDNRIGAPGSMNDSIGRLPEFRSVVQLLEPQPILRFMGRPVTLRPILESGSKADMIWTISEAPDGNLAINLTYDTGRYRADTAERVLQQYVTLLHGLAAGEGPSIFDLPLQ